MKAGRLFAFWLGCFSIQNESGMLYWIREAFEVVNFVAATRRW